MSHEHNWTVQAMTAVGDEGLVFVAMQCLEDDCGKAHVEMHQVEFGTEGVTPIYGGW